MVLGVEEIVAVGKDGALLIVALVVEVQPLVSVTVTLYVPPEAILIPDVVAPVLQA